MWNFQKLHPESERKAECEKIMRFWPKKIPIILEKKEGSHLEDVPKAKLLCPDSYNYSQFLMCLRKKISLGKDDSLFVFVGGTDLITGEKTMLSIYQDHKDPDGFLYLMYCEHASLGCEL